MRRPNSPEKPGIEPWLQAIVIAHVLRLVPLADSRLEPYPFEFEATFIVDCCRYQHKYQQDDARYSLAKIKLRAPRQQARSARFFVSTIGRPESNPAQARNLWRRQATAYSAAFRLLRSGMIENRGFDSHSLRHLRDFARWSAIFDDVVRDSALLGRK